MLEGRWCAKVNGGYIGPTDEGGRHREGEYENFWHNCDDLRDGSNLKGVDVSLGKTG